MSPASEAEQALRLLPEPVFIVTPGGDVVFANDPAERMFANSESARSLLDLAYPSLEPLLAYLRQCSGARALLVGALSLKQADGAILRFRIHGALLRPRRGAEPAHLLLRCMPHDQSQFSVLARTIDDLNSEIRRRQRTQAILEETVREKEMLLRELHHRVHNNLQMLAGMVAILRRDSTNAETALVLNKLGGRLLALATLQRLTYQTSEYEEVPAKRFIEELTRAVLGAAAPEATLSIEVADANLPNDIAFPIALILNELLLNAVKYGLRSGKGAIGVRLRSAPDTYELEVRDDGPGLPAAAGGPARRSSGLEIVRGLCRQASGAMDVETGDGTRWILRFPKTQPERRKAYH